MQQQRRGAGAGEAPAEAVFPPSPPSSDDGSASGDEGAAGKVPAPGAPPSYAPKFEWVVWSATAFWSMLFVSYIYWRFFSLPWDEWDSVTYYGQDERHAVPIAVHWAAGSLCMVSGAMQLFPEVRRSFPAFHRWNGRIALGASAITVGGGSAYLILNGTVGGPPMTVAFWINGILFAWAIVMTWKAARARDFARHRCWAIRCFALMTSSAFYRLLIAPLFVMSVANNAEERNEDDAYANDDGGDKEQSSSEMLYLNVASWLFYFPQLLAVEIYFWWERGQAEQAAPEEVKFEAALGTSLLSAWDEAEAAVTMDMPGEEGAPTTASSP